MSFALPLAGRHPTVVGHHDTRRVFGSPELVRRRRGSCAPLSHLCLFKKRKYFAPRPAQGQLIDIPMFETMASFVLSDYLFGRAFEPAIGKPGYVRLLSGDRRPYRTKDGYVCVVVYTTQQWQRLLTHLEDKHLEDDPRLRDIAARTSNADAVLSRAHY